MNKTESSFRNYEDAIEWLFRQLPMFSRIGAAAYKPGLQTTVAIDNFFGNPHKNFKSIHVGGTNGKGSTSHMIASILQQAGYKTGLYTSPHLVDFRERMKIDGQMIPQERVVDFVNRWRSSGGDLKPSFFELTMTMAFDWFSKEKVDFAVIEVGMGGRLDSTNVITPIASVITNISLDHTQFLGDTTVKIAEEKAGIIKPGIPVIIGEANTELKEIFACKAKSEHSSICFAEDNPRIFSSSAADNGSLSCTSTEGSFSLPLGGDYQMKNINTVLHTISVLKECGVVLSDNDIITGVQNVVKNTGFCGRWTILGNSPLVIADTGHNVAGISYNINQLNRLLSQRGDAKLRMVIGFVADKDIEKIIKLLPKDAVYYLTNAQIPRALPAERLNARFMEEGLIGNPYNDVGTAYTHAIEDSSPNDIIFIGGSTFIVADFLATHK